MCFMADMQDLKGMKKRKTYDALTTSTMFRIAVLGPSIRVKPIPAPHSSASVPGAHSIAYVVAVASYTTISIRYRTGHLASGERAR